MFRRCDPALCTFKPFWSMMCTAGLQVAPDEPVSGAANASSFVFPRPYVDLFGEKAAETFPPKQCTIAIRRSQHTRKIPRGQYLSSHLIKYLPQNPCVYYIPPFRNMYGRVDCSVSPPRRRRVSCIKHNITNDVSVFLGEVCIKHPNLQECPYWSGADTYQRANRSHGLCRPARRPSCGMPQLDKRMPAVGRHSNPITPHGNRL